MWTTLKAHHAAVSDRRFETMLDTGRAADFSATAGVYAVGLCQDEYRCRGPCAVA